MQSKYSNILPFTVILFLIATFACSDMNSISEEYMKAEKIYAGKLDSLKVLPGYKRVKIVALTRYLGNSNECTVTWDNDQSKVFTIGEDKGEEFEMIIDNLDERGYEFNVVTKDPEGNISVQQKCEGRTVGDIFKETQQTRRLKDFEFKEDGLHLVWADNAESEFVLFTQINYSNNDGGITSDTVFAEEDSTKLYNWKPLGDVEIISSVISGEQGFDTILLTKVVKTLPKPPYTELDKSYFVLVGMPSDNPGTAYGADPKQYLFDGDGSWKGSDAFGYHSGENAIPHHFTIDLGVVAKIRQCQLDLRDPNNFAGNNPTAVELWGINDIANAETSASDAAEFEAKGWKLLYRGDVNGANSQSVKFNVEPADAYRYIRYRVVSTVGGSGAQLVEMTFWGQDIGPIDLSIGAVVTVNHENPGGPEAGEGSLKLIDGDINSKYLIFDYPDKNPLRIQQELPQAEIVTSYTLTSGNDAPDRDPKNWTLLGSNNGTDWDVLDTKNDQVFIERNQTISYDVTSETAYKYYVLEVTANKGGGLFQLSEWRLYR